MKNSKRIISCVLASAMTISAVPATAYAADPIPQSSVVPYANEITNLDDLKNAITVAGDNTSTLITLGANIEVSETLTIPASKVIVLDLNGHSISATTDVNVIDNNGNLTIKNGTIAAKDREKDSQGFGIDNKSGASLTIDQDADQTTKIAGRTAIQSDGTLVINDGEITSYNRLGVNALAGSTTTINGGTISSPTGSSGYGRAFQVVGKAKITGGTITSGGSSGAGDNYMNAIGVYGNGHLTIQPAEGKTVNVESATDYAVALMESSTVDIYGGNFTCKGSRVDILDIYNTCTLNVYGGSFRHEPAAEYLASGTVVVQENDRYVVKQAEAVSAVTVNNYDELKAALNGDILQPKAITLGADVTIPSGEDVTLKQGYSLTVAAGKSLTVDGVIRLTGNLVNNGTLSVGNAGFIESPLQVTNNGAISGYPVAENGICTISTPMQLQWLTCLTEWDNSNLPSEVQLTDDITMPEGVNFTSIGYDKFFHNAVFNGNGHAINNLCVNIQNEYQGGLFGNFSDATIKDLKLVSPEIRSTSGYIGTLAGYMLGTCSVQNVSVTDAVVESDISYGVGGLVGQIYGQDGDTEEFINCSFDGNVKGYANVGGVWGTSTGSKGTIGIYNSKLSGSVKAINVNAGACGGYGDTTVIDIIGLDDDNVTTTVNDAEVDKIVSASNTSDEKISENLDKTAIKDETGNWTAAEPGTEAAVLVNGTPYTSLEAAISAADENVVTEIILQKDLKENVTIEAGKNIILDLNGFTLDGGTNNSEAALTNNGTVTIKDSSTSGKGTIKRSDNAESTKTYYVINNHGTMTIDSGNVVNDSGSGDPVKGSALICSGASSPATLTINGGTFTQNNFNAVKNDENGTLIINGGTITSKYDAVQNWKTATISGGTMNGAVRSWSYTNGAGTTFSGATTINGDTVVNGDIATCWYEGTALSESNRPTMDVQSGTILGNIYKAKTTSGSDSTVVAATDESGDINVSGGQYKNPVDPAFLADGYTMQVKSPTNTEAPYSYYADLTAAMNNAEPGATVTDLRADQTHDVTIIYENGADDMLLELTDGTSLVLPSAPSKSGYTFVGWSDGNDIYDPGDSVEITDDMNFIAVWKSNSSENPPVQHSYEVKVEEGAHGSITIADKDKWAISGEKITFTVTPDDGYVLDELTITTKAGKDVELKDNGDGTYTFTMPGSSITISATFVEDSEPTPDPEPTTPVAEIFTDIEPGSWYEEVVQFAYDKGIMTGTSDTTFEPNTTTTRGMIVSILHRLEGSPVVTEEAFSDVSADDWYGQAVAWASSEGIVGGYGDGTFLPNKAITREEMASILYRYALYKEQDVSARADLSKYTDADQVGAWAKEVMQWANAEGLINGMTEDTLVPQGNATRAQVAAMFQRYLNK